MIWGYTRTIYTLFLLDSTNKCNSFSVAFFLLFFLFYSSLLLTNSNTLSTSKRWRWKIEIKKSNVKVKKTYKNFRITLKYHIVNKNSSKKMKNFYIFLLFFLYFTQSISQLRNNIENALDAILFINGILSILFFFLLQLHVVVF